MSRYVLTAPVKHGTCWWRVADRESPIMPNFGVADFAESMPNAEAEARSLCDRLNLIDRVDKLEAAR